MALSGQAARLAAARRSAQALLFGQAPVAWLAAPTTAAALRCAIDDGQLAAVGLAAAQPALVM